MAEMGYGYASIEKMDKQPDGTLIVYGKATDDSIDIDQQICDNEWLKSAMPEWMMAGGNIREQHDGKLAAGVATDYEMKSDGHYIRAKVVATESIRKVEHGVLKGFSIGIRSPRVIRDEKAAGGRIVGGTIVEVSLVDRPANPNAKLMLAKTAENGELMSVEQVNVPTPAEAFKSVEGEPEVIETSAVEETVADEAVTEETPVEETPDLIESAKGALAELLKFDQTAYDSAVGSLSDLIIVEANEMKNGSDERESIRHLLHAIKHLFEWYEGEAAEGEVANPNPMIADDKPYEMTMSADAVCEMCDKAMSDCKCAEKADAPMETPDESVDADKSVEAIITKATDAAVASIKEELDLLKSALDAEKEKATNLAAELEVAKTAAVAGGPRRTAVNLESQIPELLSKAAGYRSKAEATTDRVLAEGYRELAADLESKAKKEAN